MTQNVAPAILAHEVAQICAQTHVCDGRLVIAPFLDGESLEQNKALAINYVFAESLQVFC